MTQHYSFNLVDEAWLPCVRQDGTAVTLSLRETLTEAHELQSLAGDSPPQTAALHRFLLAILHRVFGPEDEDEWAELWEADAFAAEPLHDYLDTWRHRFDLFDAERPFYQAAKLYLESKWVPITRLIHDLNAAYPLYNHTETMVQDYLAPAEAARALITAQNFGLCGTSGAFYPRETPRSKKKQAMFVDGNLARAVNFIIQGNSLFETLMLNLVQYPDDDIVVHFEDDSPAWEQDDPSSPERIPLLGYLDYLTWQNRRILLRPELDACDRIIVRHMRWEPADRLGSPPRDAMQHHFKKSEQYKPLQFREDKSLWRDSGSLFSLHYRDESEAINEPPAIFRWLQDLTSPESAHLEKHRQYRCLALGMSSKPGQATVYFYREESIPLHLDYFQDPVLVNRLQDALSYTEEVFSHLMFAARLTGTYLQVPDADNKKWGELKRNTKEAINNWVAHTGAERHYWAGLEIPFQTFMVQLAQQRETADHEAVLLEWLQRLQSAARAAFEQVAQCVGSDARSFKAVVRGRGYLNYRLNQQIPEQV